MPAFLERFEGNIYAGVRIIAGLMFMFHGLQKVFGYFGGRPEQMPDVLLWIAGPLELVGGAFIALGFFTRWTGFLCSGLMAAAYFMAHAPQGFFPIVNRGELAILYCWIFLLFAAKGAGPHSVDQAMGRR